MKFWALDGNSWLSRWVRVVELSGMWSQDANNCLPASKTLWILVGIFKDLWVWLHFVRTIKAIFQPPKCKGKVHLICTSSFTPVPEVIYVINSSGLQIFFLCSANITFLLVKLNWHWANTFNPIRFRNSVHTCFQTWCPEPNKRLWIITLRKCEMGLSLFIYTRISTSLNLLLDEFSVTLQWPISLFNMILFIAHFREVL